MTNRKITTPFSANPDCPKCGRLAAEMLFVSDSRDRFDPPEFLRLGCATCGYKWEMLPKDYAPVAPAERVDHGEPWGVDAGPDRPNVHVLDRNGVTVAVIPFPRLTGNDYDLRGEYARVIVEGVNARAAGTVESVG